MAPSSRGAFAPRTPRGRILGRRPDPSDASRRPRARLEHLRCTQPGDDPDATLVHLTDRIGRGPEARPDPGGPARLPPAALAAVCTRVRCASRPCVGAFRDERDSGPAPAGIVSGAGGRRAPAGRPPVPLVGPPPPTP